MILAVAFYATLSLSVFGQGSLVPSATPGPTFKTLQQVEPRTPISQPVAPNVFPITISTAGSYYLTGNLTSANGIDAIRITVPDVMLDLNGFAISTNGGGFGISVPATLGRVFVKNGTIKAFANGIEAGSAPLSHYEDLQISNCTTIGLKAGSGALVRNCQLTGNGGTHAIMAGNTSTISGCITYNNSNSAAGIQVGDNGVISHCVVSGNQSIDANGIEAGMSSLVEHCGVRSCVGSYGIFVGLGSMIVDSAASNNSRTSALAIGIATDDECIVTNSTARLNTGTGISVGARCSIIQCSSSVNYSGIFTGPASVVRNCSTTNNSHDGLRVTGGCIVEEVQASVNGTAAAAAGIYGDGVGNRIAHNTVNSNNGGGISISGTGNLVDGNHVRDNTGNGIFVSTANGKNVIIRNEAGNNGGSYTGIAAGNQTAPTGDPTTSTNPFLNILN
ncbi:MAG: hypothetical protein QOG48_2270 [Verrucomicrobiota bacterium]